MATTVTVYENMTLEELIRELHNKQRVIDHLNEQLRAGLNSEAKIRADEARQIMFALDRYIHASDYGPPIQKRIALHEGDATGGEGK